MQYTHFFLALLATGLSVALPAADGSAPTDLVERANPVAKDVICGPAGDQEDYTASQIKNAVKAAKKHWKDGKLTPNDDNFPHYYGASDGDIKNNLPDGCGVKVKKYEWALKDSKGSKDMDRVVLGESADGKQHYYCFAMTHRGIGSPAFKMCPEKK